MLHGGADRTFFVIFLLYPLLSRTTFHMMPTSCQMLAEGERWHMDDYSIDCGSATHITFIAFAAVCILAYPIGIPLAFLYLLRRNEGKSLDVVHLDNKGSSENVRNVTRNSSAFDFLKKDCECTTKGLL